MNFLKHYSKFLILIENLQYVQVKLCIIGIMEYMKIAKSKPNFFHIYKFYLILLGNFVYIFGNVKKILF